MSNEYNSIVHKLIKLPDDIQVSVGALCMELGFVLLRIKNNEKYLPATLEFKSTLGDVIDPIRLSIYPLDIESSLLNLLKARDLTMDYRRLFKVELPIFEQERDFNKIRRVIKAHS